MVRKPPTESRGALPAAALAVFGASGYGRATPPEVGERVGLIRGTVPRHDHREAAPNLAASDPDRGGAALDKVLV